MKILNDYIWKICEPKSKLTMQNMNMLIDLELLPKDLEYVSDVYKLTKELLTNKDIYNSMSQASNPYGDGKASIRIADAIIEKYSN